MNTGACLPGCGLRLWPLRPTRFWWEHRFIWSFPEIVFIGSGRGFVDFSNVLGSRQLSLMVVCTGYVLNMGEMPAWRSRSHGGYNTLIPRWSVMGYYVVINKYFLMNIPLALVSMQSALNCIQSKFVMLYMLREGSSGTMLRGTAQRYGSTELYLAFVCCLLCCASCSIASIVFVLVALSKLRA